MAATATVLKFEDYRLHAFQRHGSRLPWFVLAEVCKVLELTNTRMVAARLDDDEKGVSTTDTPGGAQQMLIVSLSGLTRLTATSRKPIAKRFNKWLHSDVVVSIFLTGEFKGDSTPLDELVGSFQPLLELPQPAKPADVVPFPSGDKNKSEVERRPSFMETVQAMRDQAQAASGVWRYQQADFWGETLTKSRAHRFVARDGTVWFGRRYLHQDGTLAEFRIYPEHLRSARMRMHEMFAPDGSLQFILRWDETATALIILALVERECGFTDWQYSETLTRLLDPSAP